MGGSVRASTPRGSYTRIRSVVVFGLLEDEGGVTVMVELIEAEEEGEEEDAGMEPLLIFDEVSLRLRLAPPPALLCNLEVRLVAFVVACIWSGFLINTAS